MKLRLLSVAFGLASLAGINLYLTVFVTGLAIHMHWISLSGPYQGLEVLGHPIVIVVAGILYFIQFFADKIPWVDSLWDSIHTVIRPVGGAVLALDTFGQANPVLDIIIALLAGSAALTTHGLKAGTRLIANTSPEPFSNIVLSVIEDILVIGGLALLYFKPLLALGILLVLFASLLYFGPKILRVLKTRLWLVWRKLNAPASDKTGGELSTALSAEHDILFTRLNLLGEKIEWTARCISTASRRIPGNCFGSLIATAEEPRKLYFVAKNGWGKIAEALDLEGGTVSHESKFLTENLVIQHPDKKFKYIFLFDRAKNALVNNLVASLHQRLASGRPGESVAGAVKDPDLEAVARQAGVPGGK